MAAEAISERGTAAETEGSSPHYYADSQDYRWRREYGGLKLNQSKRLKELQEENVRLKRAVADPTLDKLILKEAAERPEGQRQQNQ